MPSTQPGRRTSTAVESLRPAASWAGNPSLIGTLLFTVAWLVCAWLQPRYDARREHISALAAIDANAAWIMVAAFLLFGLSVMALGVGLHHSLHSVLGRAGAVTVVLCGIAVCAAGLARQDCSVQLPECGQLVRAGLMTSHHLVHDVASVAAFVFAGVAQLVVGSSLRRERGWTHLRLPSIISGLSTLALFAVLAGELTPAWEGIVERTMVVVSCTWLCVFADQLRSVHPWHATHG
ncbi:MAG: DUF998 domain-containing protein [Nocardioidaceae bacterium]